MKKVLIEIYVNQINMICNEEATQYLYFFKQLLIKTNVQNNNMAFVIVLEMILHCYIS